MLGGLAVLAPAASALTFSDESEIQFTFNPTLAMELSANALTIANLAPGQEGSSTPISVKVKTNGGYDLYATVGDAQNASTALKSGTGNSAPSFTSVATDKVLAKGEWGYKVNSSTNNGTPVYPTNYSGLPIYSGTAKKINSTEDASGTASSGYAGGISTSFLIGAYANDGQASGTYENVINFQAVTKIDTN